MAPAKPLSGLARTRERVTVGTIAVCVSVAVYTFLGLAYAVKATVEAGQKLRHPFRSA